MGFLLVRDIFARKCQCAPYSGTLTYATGYNTALSYDFEGFETMMQKQVR